MQRGSAEIVKSHPGIEKSRRLAIARRRLGLLAVSAMLASGIAGAKGVPNGAEAASQQAFRAAEALPQTPVSSVSTSAGDVLINGQPTLLVGTWEPNTVADAETIINNLDVNLLIGTSNDDTNNPNLVAAVQGQAWVLRWPDGTSRVSNQIGILKPDEPDGRGVTPDKLNNQTDGFGITYENFTQHVADGQSLGSTDQSSYSEYLGNLGLQGVATFDSYVVNNCVSKTQTVSSTYDYVASLKNRVRAINPNMPIGAYIEVADPIDVTSCGPLTAANIRDEIHLALAGGATVLNPWSWTDINGPDAYDVSGTNSAAFRAGIEEAQKLSKIVLAPQIGSFEASPNGEVIKIGERSINTGNGNKLSDVTDYVIAVNGTAKTLSSTVKLVGLENQALTSVIDNSTLQAQDGQVTFNLPPHSWQIESYVPVAAKVVKPKPYVPKPPKMVQVNVGWSGRGSVTRDPSEVKVKPGTIQMLTAHPAPGWKVGKWSGPSCSGNTQSCRVVLTQNESDRVTFVQP